MRTTLTAIFMLSCALSLVLTWLVRNLAIARGWALPPSSARHVHTVPIPRLGGVAVAISCAFPVLLAIPVAHVFGRLVNVPYSELLLLFGIGAAVWLVGLADDLRPMPARLKLALEVVAALALFACGFGVNSLGGWQLPIWLSVPATVLWVVWITNAFNLIDGLDGLAAGSALFSILVVFIVSLANGNTFTAIVSAGLAGAVLGFLRFNFNPATIFLGDSGSLFVGFMLAALGLSGMQKSSTLVAVALPVVCFGLPILDTVVAVIRRFLSGKPLFGADREHIHHKLMSLGWSHRSVVILLYGVSALFGLFSLALLNPNGGTVALVFVVIGAGILIGVQRLGYHEFREIERLAQRMLGQRRVIANNVLVRRAHAMLQSATTLGQICDALTAGFAGQEFDGFELRIPTDVLPSHVGIHPLIECGDELVYTWRSTDTLHNRQSACWRLQLDLVTGSGREMGSFTLTRLLRGKTLMADINTVTATALHADIAEALERAAAAPPLARHARVAAMPSPLSAAGILPAGNPEAVQYD